MLTNWQVFVFKHHESTAQGKNQEMPWALVSLLKITRLCSPEARYKALAEMSQKAFLLGKVLSQQSRVNEDDNSCSVSARPSKETLAVLRMNVEEKNTA